jgi:nucleotide-binding universal stress UspA family protein
MRPKACTGRENGREVSMKIVLGYDDSPHAQAALQWIIRQKWPANTKVTVVSAVRTPVSVYAEVYAPSMPYPTELIEEVTRHHEELSMKAEDELRRAGFVTSVKVPPADPREALVDAVRSENADLLVVGSHGRTGFSKLLLGSVASHVVAHAPCDVVVVKRTAH